MNIQQAMIVIVMTAIISIFVGIMLPSDMDPFKRTLAYIFVIFIWVFLIVTIDLYVSIYKLRQDVNTYATCS